MQTSIPVVWPIQYVYSIILNAKAPYNKALKSLTAVSPASFCGVPSHRICGFTVMLPLLHDLKDVA